MGMFSSWGRGLTFGVLWAEVPLAGSSSMAVPCRGGGPQPPGTAGPGSRSPSPFTGSMKEALCARPLPWPVRLSGCGMKGLFRRASALPAPGNRSRGGSPRPDAQCPSVPGTWDGPPVSPPRGAAGLGERDVPPWTWVEGARMPHAPSAGASAVHPAPIPGAPIPGARSCPWSIPHCCRLLRPVWLHPWCRSVTEPAARPSRGAQLGAPSAAAPGWDTGSTGMLWVGRLPWPLG